MPKLTDGQKKLSTAMVESGINRKEFKLLPSIGGRAIATIRPNCKASFKTKRMEALVALIETSDSQDLHIDRSVKDVIFVEFIGESKGSVKPELYSIDDMGIAGIYGSDEDILRTQQYKAVDINSNHYEITIYHTIDSGFFPVAKTKNGKEFGFEFNTYSTLKKATNDIMLWLKGK